MSAANDNLEDAKVSYSYKEAVAATGATRAMLSEMVASGEITVRRRGSRVFIPRVELERHFGSLTNAA